jgi:tetratricopeptide (TPR) repeat protein
MIISFKRFGIFFFFTAGVFFIVIFNFNINLRYPFFLLLGSNVNNPIEKIISVSFGTRNLYSDILYIRFLQYYGTREEGDWEFGEGRYPLLYSYSKDIVITDPYYTNAVIVCASSLAFGVKRINEAISILRFALSYDKDNIKYIALLSAILTFELKHNIYDLKLLDELYVFAKMNSVPDMIRNIVGFLSKKAKRYDNAIEMYELILKESRDPYYLEIAKKQIEYIDKIKNNTLRYENP